MRNILTTLLLSALALSVSADDQLDGYLFAQAIAPDGTEWQSPEKLSLNKLLPHAHIFPFADAGAARRVLPEGSAYYQSLDGTWKFHWAPTPEQRAVGFADASYDVSAWDDIRVPGCWNVQGLGKHGEMKYGVPIYVNQPVIFYHEVRKDDWREGVMRDPKDPRWTTSKYRNEVGSYRRTFTVPAAWKDRQVIINFDGVDSFFYLWVNGHYVGFSKNSRNTARFDITPYLQNGENVLAVEVYRSSDGSFLEAQDMFRLPGIFRSTYLTAMPKVQFSDLVVRTTQLSAELAAIKIGHSLSNLTNKVQKGLKVTYSIYPVKLFSDETGDCVRELNVDGLLLKPSAQNTSCSSETTTSIDSPLPWSAEAPHRYVLVAELKDKKGRLLDCTSTYFGLRTVEIRDTEAKDDEFGLAGRYFYVNDKPVKLKGVNRHETNPSTGHAITRQQMEEEVMLMKRGNINHVRLSHYSNDPYFYYLADKYGLYLEDEANIESHEYYYGDASLSHPKEWRAAHVARNMEAVRAHVNHPSIVIWSLGNEAGPGENFKAAYDAIKKFDDSRPVQYERNNDIVDMGSNQYPSVDWVRFAVKGTGKGIKYPYHISEYAHSMGNSLGNLVDYWQAIESTNFFCGAAIWDWVDQAIDTYTPDGTKYLGYGGDHGDWPNDGMFCMNGIMLPDLTPKPQYFEVKKVYQNVAVTLNGIKEDKGKTLADFTIFNKNYFEPLTSRDYDIVVCLIKDGEKRDEAPITLHEDILPRMGSRCYCPVDMSYDGEYFLNVEFRLKKDMPWAKKGYVQMAEQLSLGNIGTPLYAVKKGPLNVTDKGSKTIVSGKNFDFTFDNETGSLCGIQFEGKTILEDSPLLLSAFRAPVDNDNWARDQWFKHGLYDLQHKVQGKPVVTKASDGSVLIAYTVVSQARGSGGVKYRAGKAGQPYESVADAAGDGMTVSFTTTQFYNVFPGGLVVLASSITTSEPDLPLPRLGYEVKLPGRYNRYTYYGRGPLNNYNDRKTGSFVGIYHSTVQEQFVPFPKPQSMGNREDVRWCALQDEEGYGLAFSSELGTMSTSALPWSALQMTLAQHPHELPQSDGTYLHLDCKVNGLGGNSCGQGGPLKPDRVLGELHRMKLTICPFLDKNEPSGFTNRRTFPCPVAILRDKAGKVTIVGDTNSDGEPLPVSYSVGKGKAQKYTEPFDLKQGGTLYAWYDGGQEVKTSATFEKIEKVPVEVVYVSSEEGPGGEYGKNLVDGDPSTIWHTMYSITVPKYPHWVDFDCGEEKVIKGFTYLPRQDGSPNGNIKAYKLQLSGDGKTWTDAVCEGEFDRSPKEKKVLLPQPQRARYLRFTAVSSQNGADFASGAEFNVLAE